MNEFKKEDYVDIIKSGYIPSEPKHTDFLYSAVYEAQPIPDRYFSKRLPQIDQGKLGSCHACSIVNILNRQETLDENKTFSIQYQYSKTKETDGKPETQGSTIDGAFSIPVKYGAMLEKDWAYKIEFPPEHTTPERDAKAAIYKSHSYARLSTIGEMCQAIVQTEAIGFGCLVMDSWYRCTINSEGKYVVAMPWGMCLGGHLMTLCGFDKLIKLTGSDGAQYTGAFLVANTWNGWGDEGYAWLPFAWIDVRTDLGMKFWDFGVAIIPKIENPTGATKRKVQLQIGSTKYTINGFESTADVAPIIQNNRTLCPVRLISEALGYAVSWDEPTQTVKINDGKTFVNLKIGSKIVTVNGVNKELDVPAQIINNRTFVPIRFISEALGLDVNWNQMDSIVTIIK